MTSVTLRIERGIEQLEKTALMFERASLETISGINSMQYERRVHELKLKATKARLYAAHGRIIGALLILGYF